MPLSDSDARLAAVVDDLAAESADAFRVVASLTAADWDAPTPAEGWMVRDQISHLARFDDTARLALTNPAAFRRLADGDTARGPNFPDQIAWDLRHLAPHRLASWFRRAREQLLHDFRGANPALKLPWYGPPMSPTTSATARLMETWAHIQDVADGLGIERQPTERLRHIAHIGVRTMAFSFTVHGLPAPQRPVRVTLTSPGGDSWTWGPPNAADAVTGTAHDFCLVVTQRRHRADTALNAEGDVARQWLSIAQAFAGPTGTGREAMTGTRSAP
ncbi:TIGR03084 family metal-binding protein [Yinghuangia sp. YIM S09857]|uniref:TIGR03084 family metal-binding protein n=1 Tax=Yinghuangia sp. YIM S09857 TaxID=3436929 RepID=UPI003F5398BF